MFGRRIFLKYVEFKFITLNDKRDRIDIILDSAILNCEDSVIQLISANYKCQQENISGKIF